MSSEEVAELAKAIHNHADVLYESWKKGQEAYNMKRMEDTLELLADPGLTPKLEHLVSTFVRRDKAKRQQFQQQFSPPPESDDQKRETSPLGSSSVPRKPLPKSILAVVQRFETQGNGNKPEVQRERSPIAGDNLVKFAVPGVGAVTKNVLWAESINKHQTSEKVLDRMSPTPGNVTVGPASPSNHLKSFTTEQSIHLQSGNGPINRNNSNSDGAPNEMTHNISHTSTPVIKVQSSPQISPTNSGANIVITSSGKVVRNIPIERIDEPMQTNNNHSRATPRHFISNKQNSSPIKFSSPSMYSIKEGSLLQDQNKSANLNNANIQELEREEEKLFQALRTGQVLIPGYSPSPPPQNNGSNNGSVHISPSVSPNYEPNSNGIAPSHSRVAFAKERIRQSQENPLTQQRLELQKRLPSPSGSLAAAIAVQQGKLKFQHGTGGSQHHVPPPTPPSDDEPFTTSTVKENGRNSFVRFGPGATVADRVQLFEKYPSNLSSLANNLKSSLHSNFNLISGAPANSTVLLSSQEAPWPKHVVCNNASNKLSHITSQVSNQLQSQIQPNATAPWRTSPVRENSQQHIIPIHHDQVAILIDLTTLFTLTFTWLLSLLTRVGICCFTLTISSTLSHDPNRYQWHRHWGFFFSITLK